MSHDLNEIGKLAARDSPLMNGSLEMRLNVGNKKRRLPKDQGERGRPMDAMLGRASTIGEVVGLSKYSRVEDMVTMALNEEGCGTLIVTYRSSD